MLVVIHYHGVDNIDVTLDDNISYLIGKYFYDNKMEFNILSLKIVKPKPNINDELIQYEVEIGVTKTEFRYEWILDEFKKTGFEKGLTIKSLENKIIYSDLFTADIQQKRKLKK